MEQSQSLASVVDGIFAGSVTEFTASTGQLIKFKRAGIVQLGQITLFFNKLADAAPKDKIEELILLVAAGQRDLQAAGKSVFEIDLNSEMIVGRMMGNRVLLLEIFAAMAEEIPKFCSIFATVSTAEYNDLPMDEQLVIAAGIVAVNYGFFTQSLPPIIKSVISGWKTLKSVRSANGGKLETNQK